MSPIEFERQTTPPIPLSSFAWPYRYTYNAEAGHTEVASHFKDRCLGVLFAASSPVDSQVLRAHEVACPCRFLVGKDDSYFGGWEALTVTAERFRFFGEQASSNKEHQYVDHTYVCTYTINV